MIEKEGAFHPGKPVKALSASSKIQCERSSDMIRFIYAGMSSSSSPGTERDGSDGNKQDRGERGNGRRQQGRGDKEEEGEERGQRGSGPPCQALKVLYLNAQSIVKKVNELSCVAGALNPDIIMITESWCNSDVADTFLSIDGYDLQPDLRADREDTAQGRGGDF
jgi:hypothetical protein